MADAARVCFICDPPLIRPEEDQGEDVCADCVKAFRGWDGTEDIDDEDEP